MGRKGLTSDTVILRAAEIADADGLAAVTLAAVARSLEVQTPSLYAHIADLSALNDGVTVLALNELGARIEAGISGRSGVEALTGFAEAHRNYASDHPGRWDSLQRRAGQAAVRDPAAARVGRGAAAVLHGYNIPAEDTVHAIRVVGSALNGFLNLERIGSFDHSEPQPQQSWVVLLEFLHFTLSHWNQRGQARKDQ